MGEGNLRNILDEKVEGVNGTEASAVVSRIPTEALVDLSDACHDDSCYLCSCLPFQFFVCSTVKDIIQLTLIPS